MKTMEMLSLNENIASEQISMPYPHLMMSGVDNALALVLPAIPTGDLPVLCEHKGVIRQVGSIRKSAVEVNKLRRIGTVCFVKSKGSSVPIECVDDIMEVFA